MAQATRSEIPQSFSHEMEMSEEEVNRRKEFLEFGDEDVEALKSLNNVAQRYADPVIEDLYRHFLSFEETRAFFRDPKVLERVKRLQKEYFLRLTDGEYDAKYIADRLRIGTV